MTPSDNLMDFVTTVSGDAFVKVEENLGEGFVRLNITEAERRQAKHDIRSVEDALIELLRNARDAHAQRIFVATARESDRRTLLVLDDGIGLPESMRERIFEPRVTSKLDTMVVDTWGVHGRGMALFSIRSNAASARVVVSAPHKGTSLVMESDASVLVERADQSTWPSTEVGEDGVLHVARGPHNLVRRAVEFGLEYPGVDVYVGSPSEILATLLFLARTELDQADLMFSEQLHRLPLWQRPSAAHSAADLVDAAAELGIVVSERTAHRILAGQIAPVKTVVTTIQPEAPARESSGAVDIYRDRRGLKIHHADLSAFQSELERAFDVIAERYYVHLRTGPRITVGRDEIRVRFDIDKES